MNHESAGSSLPQSSVTTWMQQMREGDEEAGRKLYLRYFEALVGHARRLMPRDLKRAADEEDMAMQAMAALLGGLRAGRFATVGNRDELWQMLTLVVHRRVLNLIRREGTGKRKGRQSATDSRIEKARPPGKPRGMEDPDDPAWIALVLDNLRTMMAALPREDLRRVALLRMSNHSVDEIAAELGVVRRTVERKLNLVRQVWKRFL